MLVWSKKSCLGQAKIASFVFLVLFKDGRHSMSPKLHFFFFFLMLIKGTKSEVGTRPSGMNQ